MSESEITVRADDLKLFFDLVIENGMAETNEECAAADRLWAVLEAVASPSPDLSEGAEK